MFIGIDPCIIQGRTILIISDQKHCLINILNHYKFAVKNENLVVSEYFHTLLYLILPVH